MNKLTDKTGKMDVVLLTLSTIFLSFLLIYFYDFQYFLAFMGNSMRNLLFVLVLFSEISILTYFALTSTPKSLVLVLPQFLIFSFISRSILSLLIAYPHLDDPYYYFSGTLNILNIHSLEPLTANWYWGITWMMNFPSMHILSSVIMIISGVPGSIESFQFAKFLPPLYGTLTFLIVYLIGKEVTKDINLSLLGAFLASSTDAIIASQSQYHVQGFSILLFLIFVFFFIKWRTNKNKKNLLMLLIIFIPFLLSHRFSTVLFVLFIFVYTIFLGLWSLFNNLPKFSFLQKSNLFAYLMSHKGEVLELRKDIPIFLTLIAPILFYQLYNYELVLKEFISISGSFKPFTSLLKESLITPYINFTYYLRYYKYLVFILAIYTIIKAMKRANNTPLKRIIVFTICFVILGVAGSCLVHIPIDRVYIFYAPFASILAAMTLGSFFRSIKGDSTFLGKRYVLKIAYTSIIALIIIMPSTLNVFHISYYLHTNNTGRSKSWTNNIPPMEAYYYAGKWIYYRDESKFITFGTPRMIPFYFGEKPLRSVLSYNQKYVPQNSLIIAGKRSYPNSFRKYTSSINIENKASIFQQNSLIYDNGFIEMFRVFFPNAFP